MTMSVNNKKPLLAITMGDPAGIGHEIAAMAWTRKKFTRYAGPCSSGTKI